ncbi:hypothetical protein CAMGR0001_0380 [Campylobacter gracilis RM3268]|uniref:Uncharacterized protein n=1 Tax=Campylobacter gracilis RM3268 TaxID=553220 RepID=C8PHD6_9BACT|nr:hypothetical protein CAMGR0001_0380 [Campylobacter gracilis RM3268]
MKILITQRKIFHFCCCAAFFYKNFALLLWCCVFVVEFRDFLRRRIFSAKFLIIFAC